MSNKLKASDIDTIIMEALQILKKRQEAEQQIVDTMLTAMQNRRLVEENEGLRRENDRLLEQLRVLSLFLNGFVGPVPTSDEWRMMCNMVSEYKAALRQGV